MAILISVQYLKLNDVSINFLDTYNSIGGVFFAPGLC